MSSSVFVIGASGYIGKGIALAFRRAGYRVYGLIRNEKHARNLIENEIEPIVTQTFDNVQPFADILNSCSIIIDAVGYTPKLSVSLLEAAVKVGKARTQDGKLSHYAPLYIFTSGIMTCKFKIRIYVNTIVCFVFQMVIHLQQVVVQWMK
jgi:NAD(P)-dependent dehydrogenase (short-subunit alcohol dehydrogenase family)